MGVKEDLQDLFEKVSKLRGDPEKFRTAIAGVFLLVGLVLVKMPLSARFASKQADLQEAKLIAANAENVELLSASVDLFSSRLQFPSSAAKWQAYYYQIADQVGVGIAGVEDSQTKGVFDFMISEMEITAIGGYSEILAFIDTLERGKRLVRLEEVKMSVADGMLTLKCRLIGITREGTGPEELEGEDARAATAEGDDFA